MKKMIGMILGITLMLYNTQVIYAHANTESLCFPDTVCLTKDGTTNIHTIKLPTNQQDTIYWLDDTFSMDQTEKDPNDVPNEILQYVAYGYNYPTHTDVTWYFATQQRIWETMGYDVTYQKDGKDFKIDDVLSKIDTCIQNDHTTPLPTSIEVYRNLIYSFSLSSSIKNFLFIQTLPSYYSIQMTDDFQITSKQKGEDAFTYQYGIDMNHSSFYATSHTISVEQLSFLQDTCIVHTIGVGTLSFQCIDAFTHIPCADVVVEISQSSDFQNSLPFTTDVQGHIQTELAEGTYFYRILPAANQETHITYTGTFEIVDNETTSLSHPIETPLRPISLQISFEDNVWRDISITIQEETKGYYEITIPVTTPDITIELPEGFYTIQCSSIKYMDEIPKKTIQVHENMDQMEIHYTLHRTRLHVISMDAITEQPLKDDITYHIYDASGVLQSINDGLPYGTYLLVATSMPYGYQANNAGLWFEIDGVQDELSLSYPFMMLLGQAKFHISALVPSYKKDQLQWNKGNLAHTTLELRAKEDIIGHEGTVFYRKGEIIQTKVTNKKGNATFDNLPLGKYEVDEIQIADGYRIAKTTSFTIRPSQLTPSFYLHHQHTVSPLSISFTKDSSIFDYDPQATWQLVAEDNIYENGTLIYSKGTVVLTFHDDTEVELMFPGKYRLVETNCHEAFEHHEDIPFVYRYQKKMADIFIHYKLNKQILWIDFIDDASKELIEPLEFTLQTLDGKIRFTNSPKTNESYAFEQLEIGNYEIVDIVLPDSFEPLTTPISVIVTTDELSNQIRLVAKKIEETIPVSSSIPLAITTGCIIVLVGVWYAFSHFKHH